MVLVLISFFLLFFFLIQLFCKNPGLRFKMADIVSSKFHQQRIIISTNLSRSYHAGFGMDLAKHFVLSWCLV